MTTTTTIEKTIINNPKIATLPQLEAYSREYLAALEAGYTPSTTVLTKMFDSLDNVTTTKPSLAAALTALETELVEQVILRDPNLATNAQLGAMLTFYAGIIANGYEPDAATTAAIVAALDGVTTTNPVLQDLLDDVTGALAPAPELPASFGVRFLGDSEWSYIGESVSSAGDVNGDGLNDLLIGAEGAGVTYVVFGTEEGFDPVVSLATLDGMNGFALMASDPADAGASDVSSAGDVNGDGIDDILIGASRTTDANGNPDVGQSYVVFGSAAGFSPSVDLSALNGENGFTLTGVYGGGFTSTGAQVSAAGDVNGDGIDDILIGAYGAGSGAGATYVVYGREGGFPATFDLASLDGTNGFTLMGVMGAGAGASVSSAGDINGDGIDDILVGANSADPAGKTYAGEAYVVFGRTAGFTATVDLATLDGTNGFTIAGLGAGDQLGYPVSSAGDVNGDGIDDILVGAPSADPSGVTSAGETYVVFGRRDGFSATLDLATLDGTNGFVMTGIDEWDFSGMWTSSAGDVNGDGIDDVLVGASQAADTSDPSSARVGEVYLVFGRTTPFAPTLDLASLDGTDGLILKGVDNFDYTGDALAPVGDVNGDGADDILIGARAASTTGLHNSGEAYLVYGGEDIFDRFDLADGTRDGVIHLENLGLNPADYDLVA